MEGCGTDVPPGAVLSVPGRRGKKALPTQHVGERAPQKCTERGKNLAPAKAAAFRRLRQQVVAGGR